MIEQEPTIREVAKANVGQAATQAVRFPLRQWQEYAPSIPRPQLRWVHRLRDQLDRLPPHFRTRDGIWLYARPIRIDDTPQMVEFFRALSPEARRRRFHTNVEHLNEGRVWQMARELSSVDNETSGGALVALYRDRTGEHIVGVARVARAADDPTSDEAEVAVVVRDDFQGQGVGSALMRRLVRLARRMEIETLVANMDADNTPVIKLFRRLDLETQSRTRSAKTEMRLAL